ncbi:hypothetical protein N9N67_05390 [Bacteriovoracaceae bacterium]|nr:hypothetical protein [Bacteriovoracaceae bacterium]
MKTQIYSPNLKNNNNLSSLKNKSKAKQLKETASSQGNTDKIKSRSTAKKSGDYKLDISPEAKKAASSKSDISIPKPSLSKPDLPNADLKAEPKAKFDSIKYEATKEVTRQKMKAELDKVYNQKAKAKKINEPAVFFIKGSEFISSSTSGTYSGMEQLSDNVDYGKVFNWNQKDEIKSLIKQTRETQPVILVGHSFGSDTAYEIADELNSLDEGFRKIDLLVTLDSVGYSNDVIPSNVSKNLNYITDNSIFSDAPNVAKDDSRTEVQNKLLELDHTDIDDDTEIQKEIVENIKALVSMKIHNESKMKYETALKIHNKNEMN